MSNGLLIQRLAANENPPHKPHRQIRILAAAVLIVASIGCSAKKSEPASSSPEDGAGTPPKASLRSVEPLRAGQKVRLHLAPGVHQVVSSTQRTSDMGRGAVNEELAWVHEEWTVKRGGTYGVDPLEWRVAVKRVRGEKRPLQGDVIEWDSDAKEVSPKAPLSAVATVGMRYRVVTDAAGKVTVSDLDVDPALWRSRMPHFEEPLGWKPAVVAENLEQLLHSLPQGEVGSPMQTRGKGRWASLKRPLSLEWKLHPKGRFLKAGPLLISPQDLPEKDARPGKATALVGADRDGNLIRFVMQARYGWGLFEERRIDTWGLDYQPPAR